MQRAFSIAVLITYLLAFPLTARAQQTIKLANLDVQLWPEYDQPAMLVIYEFKLTDDIQLPVTVSFHIPSGANLQAVAEDQSGSLMVVEHQPPTIQGDWAVVTFDVTDKTTYRIEYYAPLAYKGMVRSFTFNWPGDYEIKKLSIQLQEPVGSKSITTNPALPSIAPGTDGFVYHSGDFPQLESGKSFSLDVSYVKNDDTLSVSSLNIQPSGGGSLDQPVNGQAFSPIQWMPWILGFLGVLLIVGGVIWYWQSGRSYGLTRIPYRSKAKVATESDETTDVYCSQCGKRAQLGDRFCRACGTRLRKTSPE